MSNMEEVLQDKEFMDRVIQMTPEDAAAAFNARGVECTADDLIKTKELLQECMNEDGSLSEAALEKIAGGGAIGSFLAGFGKALLIGGVAVGVGVFIAIGW